MDLARDLPLLLVLVGLVVAAVFLGAAEASLLRVRRVSVELMAAGGGRRARRLLSLVEDLPRVLNAVLLAVLLIQIAAAATAGVLAQRALGNLGVTIGSVVLTVVLFVYGEALPKTYAVRYPLGVALAMAWPVSVLASALRPVVSVLVWFADLQAPGRGIEGPAVTEAELIALAAEAEAAGQIETGDLRLIERAFRLGDRSVDEIMVPRTDIVAVAGTAPLQEALDAAVASGHRRLPVFSASLDDVTGVVRLRDLAASVAERSTATAGELASPVLFVPETKQVTELLADMQERGVHLAVVVDEHGGTAGLVTIEDVVEELVGEVADEGEAAHDDVRSVGPGRWLVRGGCGVVELGDATGADLPEGDWTTIAGLVIGLGGRILQRGDEVEAAGLRFRVRRATRRRVELIEVERA